MQGIPANAYAIVTKIHHAAVDGVSGISVTAVLHDLQREPAKQDIQKVPGEPMPTPMELLGRTAVADATRPLRALRVLPSLAKLSVTRATLPPAPRTRFNGRVSGRRTFDAVHFPVERLRAIKLLTPGATVNDVVLTIVGGGLRSYLEAHGELPERSLTAMVPVSTRKELGQSNEGNEISQIVVALGTDIASATERLQAVHRTTAAAKQEEQRLDQDTRGLLAELAEVPPAPWVAFTAKSLPKFAGNPLVNTVVTNVKAPPMPLYSCGAKLLRVYASGPVADGAALFHTALSYCGQLNLSVMSCVEILPDIAFYLDCLLRTFDQLSSAIAE
jgi:WS/DGAT/MGAT family acyltransferase